MMSCLLNVAMVVEGTWNTLGVTEDLGTFSSTCRPICCVVYLTFVALQVPLNSVLSKARRKPPNGDIAVRAGEHRRCRHAKRDKERRHIPYPARL